MTNKQKDLFMKRILTIFVFFGIFLAILMSTGVAQEIINTISPIIFPTPCDDPAYILPNGLPSDYNYTCSINYSAYWGSLGPDSFNFEYYNQTTGLISKLTSDVGIDLTLMVNDNYILGHLTLTQFECYAQLLVEFWM